ncbi:MAG: cell division ATP-binding protein FtsE [Candidatus Wallbacteria bacterium]|nr:cell division ATP-binding protein FtsE [Candidatus Wallbacteria bacterium]
MIRLFHVSKIYNKRVKALDNISLHIKKGEFVFLVGPAGAGKTTMLKLLYRDISPTEGQILIDGRNIESLKNNRIPQLRRSMGLIFQDFKLLDHKTVFENVALSLQILGLPDSVVSRQTEKAVNQVGLANKRDHFPDQLSGGEKQKACFARAIVNDPPLIITDEPTGNLDPEASWDIMKLLLEYNMRGSTVIVATHASHLVDRIRKRVVALIDGKVVKDESKGVYSYEGL